MYLIKVSTQDGATDGAYRETREEIDGWMANWQDPENLSAAVTDAETGEIVAVKPRGVKKLDWN